MSRALKRKVHVFIKGLLLMWISNAMAGATWPTPTRSPVSVTPPEGQVLIFASTTMPAVSLKALYQEAALLHRPLIFRGLSAPTLPEMAAELKATLGDEAIKRGGIAIDPIAFERFAIETVPTVVVVHRVPVCPSTTSCPAPLFDRVSGNVSLEAALSMLADKGEAAPDVAKAALNDLQKEEGFR